MSSLKRREFLHRTLKATAGSAAFASMMGKFELAHGAIGGPQLSGSTTDYRALVCLFLYGGNDCFNMVVPRDGGYSTYATTRTNLAVPQAQLLAINPTTPPQGGGLYGLHPSMTGTRDMFNAGSCAIVANAGPLVRPTNKTMYNQAGTLLPAQLFSHSDQSVLWQTPRADTAARTGWGGRLADIFAASNVNQTLSMNVSLDGDNVFQAGVNVSPYFMSAWGVEQINPILTGNIDCSGTQTWNRRRCLTFNALLNRSHSHPFERAYVNKVKSTIQVSAQVAAAIAQFPENDPIYRPFWDAFGLPWNPSDLAELPYLAKQLLMIARVIRARSTLQMSRQLFFAAIGGFDTHDSQLNDHPNLLRELSQSVKAFYDVLQSPTYNLGNKVTTFTSSEFGRTLTNNGDGTDHGWGGHHLVFGQGVQGGRIYGRMPSLAPTASNPDDAGWGQIIPTLSVDQYAATIAKWYGLTNPTDINTIFPNLVHMTGSILSIPGPDLGFMLPA
jgi:uncharacterized protein (DUF1501 family)